MDDSKKADTRLTSCPICGGTEFSWGYMQGRGLDYWTDDTAWLARLLPSGNRIRVRFCKACENLQMFAG